MASSPAAILPGQGREGGGQLREVPHVRSEEVAETQELPDLMHTGWRAGLTNRPQLVGPRFDSFFCEPETQVCDILASECTLGQVDLDFVQRQTLQQFIQQLQVLAVVG